MKKEPVFSFPAIAKTLPKTYQAKGEKAAKELSALFSVSPDGHVVNGKTETSIRFSIIGQMSFIPTNMLIIVISHLRADELLGFLVTKRKSAALNETQLHRCLSISSARLLHISNKSELAL